MRKNIKELPQLYFNGCGECAECCEGKFFLAPLILEDFPKVEKYFKIRAIILDEVIPVMLLTDGYNSCKYLLNGQCSIYENRPPACKIYPFSPFYDDIFIDLSCPAVREEGDLLLPRNKEEYFQSLFFENRFIDFKYKREKTIAFMKMQKLTFDKEIKGIKLYKFL